MLSHFRVCKVMLILLWTLLTTVYGNDKIRLTTSTTDLNARYFSPRTFKSKLILWKARCQRERNNQKLHKETRLFTKPTKQGTFLTFQKPTPERVSSWYWATDTIQFNHPFVGITNPFLHVDSNKKPDMHTLEVSNQVQGNGFAKETKLVSRRGKHSASPDRLTEDNNSSHGESPSGWWPDGPWKGILARQKSSSWRVLCYRKRVGYGRECYERVKQSALANEFDVGGQKGIISVIPPQTKTIAPYHRFAQPGLYSEIYANKSNNAQALWPGGGRRLATFTRSGPLRWLRVFAINPVSVVYEMEDQRMEDPTGERGGCLYTSTAFATCQGHWLAGEERVTVAMRDDDTNDHSERGAPVDVEILSLSRPAPSLVGKIAWPFIGKMQNTFFVQQLKALEKVATSPHCAHYMPKTR